MKKVFTILVVLICLQTFVFPQTKVDEYESRSVNSDDESGRMDSFIIQLRNEPQSKGLIIQFVTSKTASFGNLSSHLKGVREYLKIRSNLEPQRYAIQIKEGKPRKELWIYPKDVELPESDLMELKIDDEKNIIHYGKTCIDCGPTVPLLSWNYIDFDYYSSLIKTNDSYKALITIHQFNNEEWSKEESYQDAINNVIAYRKLLVEDYRIPKDKVKILIKNSVAKPNSPGIANFYIIKK